MKKGLVILIYSLIFSFIMNCAQVVRPTSFIFSEKQVSLPNKLNRLKTEVELSYFVYRGFRGSIGGYELAIQLKNYPIWIGRKNIKESFYFEKDVVGMTFIKPKKKFHYSDVKNDLEKQLQSKFTI